jgi:hypothetical protein
LCDVSLCHLCNSTLLQLAGDEEGAHDSISQASVIYEKQPLVVMALFVAPYIVSHFFVDVEHLKRANRLETSSDLTRLRKQAYETGKAAIQNSHKYKPYKTKILRLMGLYYWLINKQNKAVKWWKKAIEGSERLGARPDLARTYMEIGRWFLEEKSKYKELNGIKAGKYLDMAEEMFIEMDLQRDLAELDRIVLYRDSPKI